MEKVPIQVCLAQHCFVCILLANMLCQYPVIDIHVPEAPQVVAQIQKRAFYCLRRAATLQLAAVLTTKEWRKRVSWCCKLKASSRSGPFSKIFQVACLVEFVKAFSKLALDATRTERKRIQSLMDTVGRLHKSAQFLSTKVMPGRSAIYTLSVDFDLVVFVQLTASRSGTVCIYR